MNKQNLEDKLKYNKVPSDIYSLDESEGYYVEDSLCLRQNYGKWLVFYQEPGRELNNNDIKEFKTESDACEYFFEYIK